MPKSTAILLVLMSVLLAVVVFAPWILQAAGPVP